MKLTQVSAFLENRPGRLLYLLEVLADNGVNILAHNIVDASDFGIVHLIVDEPERALNAIRDAGMTCSRATVLVVAVPNEPGAFVERILKPLADAQVNIEYSYAYSESPVGKAMVVIKVDNDSRGENVLKSA